MLRNHFFAFAASLALGSLAATAVPAYAAGGQTGMVMGTIVDAANATVPDADVVISAPSGTYRAHTDGKGKFRILGANVDSYTITVQKNGFAKLVETGVDVTGDQTLDLGTLTLQKA